MKKADPNKKANKDILILTYAVAALFTGLILYFGWFMLARSEDVINNSYNARLDSFSDRVVRGRILDRTGNVLAETSVGEDGSESRVYLYDNLFAHAVGYSSKGKTGLEALGNFYLLSSHVNLAEQVLNELSGRKNQGDDLVTSLDLTLQKTAYDALGDRRGAVAAIEPATGRILAMVSKPDYNPNTIAEDWEELTSPDNTSAQLLNRASQGLYPPGSTFKIIMALEYRREHPTDYKNYEFDCDGHFEYEDYTIRCYHDTAHGREDFVGAFANSCNGAFAGLGLSTDLARLKETAGQLLYNTDLPVSIASSKSTYGLEPGADTWQILQTSIGQGQTQMTPLHNALLAAAIGNGGILMKPSFIDRVENVGGDVIKSFSPTAYGPLMTPEEAAALTELMRAVVTDGTGSAVRTDAYTAAGKTGSAEFDSKKETHAWFVGFAPAENPRIAVCVVVEEGGSGGRAAAPVARAVFDSYFSMPDAEPQ